MNESKTPRTPPTTVTRWTRDKTKKPTSIHHTNTASQTNGRTRAWDKGNDARAPKHRPKRFPLAKFPLPAVQWAVQLAPASFGQAEKSRRHCGRASCAGGHCPPAITLSTCKAVHVLVRVCVCVRVRVCVCMCVCVCVRARACGHYCRL